MTKSRSVLTGVVLGLFVMVACLLGFAGCSTAKVTGIALELDSNATAVKQGETLDLSSLKVKLEKSDKSSSEIANTEYTIVSQPDTSKLGVQQLKIEYKYDEKATYSVDVDIWVYGAFDKISVDESSYSKTMNRGETFDKDSLIIYAEYECDETKGNYKKVIASSSTTLTIGDLNTTELGEQTVNITYADGTESGETAITITIVKGFEVTGFVAPASVTNYNTNSKNKNTYTTSGSDGVKGFEVVNTATETNYIYKVGSYNKFYFKPTLKTQNETTYEVKDLTEFPMSAKVYMYDSDSNAYKEITGEDYSKMISGYDANKHSFQFTKDAENNRFKIEVYPSDPLSTEEQETVNTISFEFQVVDGYNVYNAQDLSAIDNTNINGKWNDLKNKWVSEGKANTDDLFNVSTSTFILHNNISITRDDIPASQFWTASEVAGATDAEKAVGTLKDSSSIRMSQNASIYNRELNADVNATNRETFTFEGNYFDISASDVPLIYREGDDGSAKTEDGGVIKSHTALFVIYSSNALSVTDVQAKVTDSTYETFEQAEQAIEAKAEFNNTSFTGNAGKSDSELVSGGVNLIKFEKIIGSVNNCLAQRWCIAFFNQKADKNMKRDQFLTLTTNQTNAFDGYNSIFYNYGSSINVKGCHFIGAGGPIFLNKIVTPKKNNDNPTDIVVDQESVLESYVVGTEGWFVGHDATALMTQVTAQDALLNASGKTFCKKDGTLTKTNLISILMSDKGLEYVISAKYSITGTDVSMVFSEDKTYEEIAKLVVISRVLDTVNNGTTAMDTLVKPYMQYMASQGQTLTIYQAVQSLFAFAEQSEPSGKDAQNLWNGANTLKTAYENNLAQALAACESTDETTYKSSVKYAVSQGIVFVGNNGLVFMQDGNGDYVKGLEPNADLLAEAQGSLYTYIKGTLGAILTISDYATE